MSDLTDLYQAVILDHNRKPRNFGSLEGANGRAEGHNPLCGDQVTVELQLTDGVVREAHFTGHGCAISKASASLMTASVKGKSRAQVDELFARFHAMVLGETAGDKSEIGQLVVFSGVSRFPVRVKCASLAWHTLRAALDNVAMPADTARGAVAATGVSADGLPAVESTVVTTERLLDHSDAD